MITIREATTMVIIISVFNSIEVGINASSNKQRETGTASPLFGKSNPFLKAYNTKTNFTWAF